MVSGFDFFQNEISSHSDFLSFWPHWHLHFALIIQLLKLSNLFIQAIKALNAWIYHHLKSPVTVVGQKQKGRQDAAGGLNQCAFPGHVFTFKAPICKDKNCGGKVWWEGRGEKSVEGKGTKTGRVLSVALRTCQYCSPDFPYFPLLPRSPLWRKGKDWSFSRFSLLAMLWGSMRRHTEDLGVNDFPSIVPQ